MFNATMVMTTNPQKAEKPQYQAYFY
jgi:hypothetical protein